MTDPLPAEGARPRVVLSHFQVTPLLDARRRGAGAAETSLDLGLTPATVALVPDGVALPGDVPLAWRELERIVASPNACFAVQAGRAEAIRGYSSLTDRVYSLVPTRRAPTMLVSGIYMHRVKDTDPVADTEAKVRAVAPVAGRVLDTTTGLGYTAIAAARTAVSVLTVELDPAALEMARANPWSAALFSEPRIEQRIGDSSEVIAELPDAAFDLVLHDPPRLSLAGELYGLAFYRELHRVLRPRGRLFHYVGDPNSDFGRRTGQGVQRRLREAGFSRVAAEPGAYGFVAAR